MQMEELRVIEFYSGIGGLHCALRGVENSNRSLKIVAAYEINPSANEVYRHNFPDVPLRQRNILSITSEELDELKADLFILSPPCQPFTRQGKQLDTADRRTDSLMHLLDVFSTLKNPPRFLLLENVKGFETSETRATLIRYLQKAGYSYQEFLLSPVQFGVPNSRLRYYLLARLSAEKTDWISSNVGEVCTTLPGDVALTSVGTIVEYLDDSIDHSSYLLNDLTLAKYGEIVDIVTPVDRRSCCFTKGYGHFVEGTGSVLQTAGEAVDQCYTRYRSATDVHEKAACLKPLKLRYFAPREIANLMCFPPSFGFPMSSTKQQYRLLGNSVNVKVVTALIQLLLG